MLVNIPEYLEIFDIHIAKTITFKFVKRVNEKLFLFENTKTGCKQCFSINDFVEIKNERLRTTKYERRKEIYKEEC